MTTPEPEKRPLRDRITEGFLKLVFWGFVTAFIVGLIMLDRMRCVVNCNG